MTFLAMEYQIVSNSINDSFGIEFYLKGKLILDIYRVDSAKTKNMRMYEDEVSLDLIEECIEIFRR
jgi:hypothetical protein